MKKIVFIIFLLILLNPYNQASAAAAAEQLESAGSARSMDGCNRLYHEADYRAAIDCYQALSISSAQLYNIGNSHAGLDQSGFAVLYYLRALYLAPDDSDVIANLTHVREQQSIFAPQPPVIARLFNLLTLSQWSLLCLAAPLIYLCFTAQRLIRKKPWNKQRWLEATFIFGCTALFALSAYGAWFQYQKWQQSVVVEDTRLLVSPFDKADSLGSIVQGRLVTPHKSYREYIYVIDDTGRKGWLKSDFQVPILDIGK